VRYGLFAIVANQRRTCVKGGGVVLRIAEVKRSFADDLSLPRREQARACIDFAPGQLSFLGRGATCPIVGVCL